MSINMFTESNNERLEPICWLSNQTGKPIDFQMLEANEQRAKYIHDEYSILPTIGCEIEVKWSSLFPDLAREYFGEKNEFGGFERRYPDLSWEKQIELDGICRELDKVHKLRYEETVNHGIPSGADAYWEFANSPVYHASTLATEVSLLYTHGLIPEDYEHSLHVTVGEVTPDGGGMCYVMSALELMYVSSARIVQATLGNRYGNKVAWARRGNDGIRKKQASDLKLGAFIATELRTLTSSNPIETSEQLADSQFLSVILLAFRQEQENRNDITEEISVRWPQLKTVVKRLWEARDLPAESWGAPHKNQAIWLGWAACLDRKNETGTIEAETVCELRHIITETKSLINQLD